MGTLLTELRRRHVFRVAIAYVVVSVVVLEIAEILIPLMKLPDWTLAMVLFIFIIGFPFALIIAWAFELTPDGLVRTEDLAPGQENSGTTLNRIIIGMLSLVVILLLADRLLVDETAEEPLKKNETVADEPKSIAVLPFVNLSSDPEQDYFSDGISEELLVGLAYFDGLRVAARTSAFSFKGKDVDIKKIGEQLNVDTVLEGSVRKSGQRLRITAQLINVADGFHLWSGTFDRELTDIFAIQDEISAAIIAALKIHLADDETLADTKAVNLEAYSFYLKGRENLRLRTAQSLELAAEQFRKAVDIEPEYADAWAGLGVAYRLSSAGIYGNLPPKEASDLSRQAFTKALALDPDQWLALGEHALQQMSDGDPWLAVESIERAIAANPSEGILYTRRQLILPSLGRYREAGASREQAFRVDPLHTAIRSNYADLLIYRGDYDAARELTPPGTTEALELEMEIALAQKRVVEAIHILQGGIAQSEGGENTFLSNILSKTYLNTFKAVELAKETQPSPLRRLFIDATLHPAEYYPAMASDGVAINRRAQDIARIMLLFIMGRCTDIAAIQDEHEYLQGAIWGNPTGRTGDTIELFMISAWCQGQLGRTDESRRLAQRIQGYLDEADINGTPDNNYNKAVVARILGNNDRAMQLLRIAQEKDEVLWTELEAHWWDALRKHEDFQAIKTKVWDDMNVRRAELGLGPATPYQPTIDRMGV